MKDGGELGSVADLEVLDLDRALRPVSGRAGLNDVGSLRDGLERRSVGVRCRRSGRREVGNWTHLLLDGSKLRNTLDANHRQLQLGPAPHEEQEIVRDIKRESEGETGHGGVDFVAGGEEDVAGVEN